MLNLLYKQFRKKPKTSVNKDFTSTFAQKLLSVSKRKTKIKNFPSAGIEPVTSCSYLLESGHVSEVEGNVEEGEEVVGEVELKTHTNNCL